MGDGFCSRMIGVRAALLRRDLTMYKMLIPSALFSQVLRHLYYPVEWRSSKLNGTKAHTKPGTLPSLIARSTFTITMHV